MSDKGNLTRSKVLIALVALIIGIGMGIAYAWLISPVEWMDGVPSQLRHDLQVDYLSMTIDSFSINQNRDLAQTRYEALGDSRTAILGEVGEEPGMISPSEIQQFKEIMEIAPSTSSIPETGGEGGGVLGSQLTRFLIPVCGATLLLGFLLSVALVLRRRLEGQPREELETVGAGGVEEFSPGETQPSEQPLATFRTTYSLGDDLYDDSFSVESAAGDFLGECGVGIGDVVGVGEPKKVSAFEVWLFDKNDIQTVTKVLMSSDAFNDESTRSRLAAKGDPAQAESGGVITLETASLRVDARIVDLSYGESPLPENSFFDRLTVELRAWSRMPVA